MTMCAEPLKHACTCLRLLVCVCVRVCVCLLACHMRMPHLRPQPPPPCDPKTQPCCDPATNTTKANGTTCFW
jgi:hypothetical protein